MMTQAEVREAIIKAVPYVEQVTDIDLSSEPGEAVRFTWFGVRFRVSTVGLMTETVEGGLLVSGNLATLMGTLIQRGR